LLQLFDGQRTQEEIIAEYTRRGGERLPSEFLSSIVSQLDERLLLESPHFREVRQSEVSHFEAFPTRPNAFAGRSYPDNPDALREHLSGYFKRAHALQLAHTPAPGSMTNTGIAGRTVMGCVVPHIDFGRGGAVEALAYVPLMEEKFDTLIVLGIAHGGVRYPFCLAPKDHETPLGTAMCDHDLCDALQARIGHKLTAEQWAHKIEHSVEFVAVFTQYVESLRNSKLVPIICGGFFEEIESGDSPAQNSEIAAFASALRAVCEEWSAQGKRVGFIASVDGAHVGSQFGDDSPLDIQRLADIERADREFWSLIERGDREAMHAHIAHDGNARNVDAHPALYTLFLAFPELRACLQHYAQAYNREANIVVSFAALTLFK
jgi:AmmeMemoRadiSam system protein B